MTTSHSKFLTPLLAALMFILCLAPAADARWYRADLGAWTKRDPLGYVEGVNLSSYVDSTPMSATDPYGLIAQGLSQSSGTDASNPCTTCNPNFHRDQVVFAAEPLDPFPDHNPMRVTEIERQCWRAAVKHATDIGMPSSHVCYQSVLDAYYNACKINIMGSMPSYKDGEEAVRKVIQKCLGGNGCGAKGDPVPNLEFVDACNQHDLCYSYCGASKPHCDFRFYLAMLLKCREMFFTKRLHCRAAALTYYLAVRQKGLGPYRAAQAKCQNRPAYAPADRVPFPDAIPLPAKPLGPWIERIPWWLPAGPSLPNLLN